MQNSEQYRESTVLDEKTAVWRKRALMIWALIGIAVIVYLFGFVLNALAIPVGIVIWTVIFVFCLRGQVNGLERRGIPRAWGTTIAYMGMVIVIGLVIWLITSPILGVGSQFQNLIESIPTYIDQLKTLLAGFSQAHPEIAQSATLSNAMTDLSASLNEVFGGMAKATAQGLVEVGAATANSIMCIGFALVVAFWLLLELPGINGEIQRLVGSKHAQDAHFFQITLTRVMGGYIKGTLLQCAIIAVGCAIAFSILGVPNALAFAIITGLLNIIPIIGPWLGGAAAAFAAIFVSPIMALLALVLTIAIQQVVYTFVSPKIMAESVDVHPALVILAMMVGYAVGFAMSGLIGSLVGMLLSIPLAAVAKAVFVYYFEKRTGRQLVATDGVFFRGVPTEDGDVSPEKDAVSPHPGMVAERLKADARAASRKAQAVAAKTHHYDPTKVRGGWRRKKKK